MAKKSEQKKSQAAPPDTPLDWPLLAVAVAGVLVTGVLLWGASASAGLPYCAAGSGCDIVQNSAWSKFLGMPLALWGLLAYLALATVALARLTAARRWRWSTLLSAAGFGISAYLTLVSGIIIGAFCTYCLISLALMTCAFALSFRSAVAERRSAARISGLLFAVLVAGLMHADARGLLGGEGPVDPRLRALAEHLDERGFRFYGASWCPHCQQQKALFGAAGRYLPYVECAPNGPKAARATECEVREIRNYPTWIIGERRIERVLAVSTLVSLSGFQEPGAPDAQP